jgi:predicted nucleic acid-binding protein
MVGDERWQLHLSTALLLEYEAVARREAQEFWLRPELIESVLDYLCANAQEHRISFRWRPFLPDPDDDFILELAVTAKAQYIVTHNLRDFAGVEAFGLEVIIPAQMLLKLSETS